MYSSVADDPWAARYASAGIAALRALLKANRSCAKLRKEVALSPAGYYGQYRSSPAEVCRHIRRDRAFEK
jgi:hypothetical protein